MHRYAPRGMDNCDKCIKIRWPWCVKLCQMTSANISKASRHIMKNHAAWTIMQSFFLGMLLNFKHKLERLLGKMSLGFSSFSWLAEAKKTSKLHAVARRQQLFSAIFEKWVLGRSASYYLLAFLTHKLSPFNHG